MKKAKKDLFNGVGIEHVCPVCNKTFISAPQHIYKHAKTHKFVCSYSCRCKSEQEKNARYNNLISRDNRR